MKTFHMKTIMIGTIIIIQVSELTKDCLVVNTTALQSSSNIGSNELQVM